MSTLTSCKCVLPGTSFIEEWGENEKEELVRCLANTLKTNGIIYGAFDGERLVGFMSVEGKRFGSQKQYVELSSIHVDHDYRGRGIGRQLFECAVSSAESLGAKKLYISAHSSVESQAFYRKMGCVEAQEFNPSSLEKEPCDCQLESTLERAGSYMAIYMSLGMCFGMSLGLAFDNMAVGMCLGMAVGVAVGAGIDASKAKERAKTPAGEPVAEGLPTRHPDNVDATGGGVL